jgi:alpha-tubulin suppressor-like RCC1 family protein
MRDKLSNVWAIEKSGMIPGIPTFLSQLSQIKITRLSAHPRGHHVLLVSDEGMLFSYGSNDRGQLGLGKQHFKVTAPQLITPLLENGGKTVQCAAGLDYSLVVVRTEGSRIAHRRRQQQRNQTTAVLNERNAHQQMYAFGCNNNNKLGLLDPDKSLHKSYSGGSPRRRLRKSETDSSPIQSPEPPSPSSLISTPGSVGDDSTADGRSTLSTDVYLPRRVALHCKVIDKKDSPETPTRRNKSAAESIPYGIFSLAASTQHSAALVKRPGGSVELYTWGRGEDGKLGLPVPGADQPLTPTRRWDHLCCGSIDNDDETLNSLIDDSVSPGYDVNNTQSNQSATTPYFVSSPTMVTSLSLLIDSEKTNHPPLPKKNTYLLRSPRKSPKKQSSYTETNSLLLESEHVVKVALGPNCTHVVTSTGRWLVFGSSQDGLLALGGHIHNAYQPVEVKLPLAFGHETMSSISIGETHGIALTSTGKVFTWGVSAGGALGRSNKSYIPIPQPILLPNLLRGHALSSALTRHLRGEASQPSKTKTKSESREGSATDSTPVAYVHAGKDLSVFILRSGSIYTCGKQSGRLGQGDLSIGVSSPTELFGGIQMWRSERP